MSAARQPRRRRRSAHEEEHGANHERWLLTYADMITLLMVLFIVLFAVSVVDKQKFAQLADGLSHQLSNSPKVLPAGTGVLPGGQTESNNKGQLDADPAKPIQPIAAAPVAPNPADAAQQSAEIKRQDLIKQEQQALSGAKAQIENALKQKGLQNSVSFQISSRGLVVSIVTDQVLFDTGQADLKPVGQQILDAIAPALRSLPNDISVEGHTDNVPITGGPFASNWELSAVRATTVLRYLVANDSLAANHMSATGYADTRPTAANDTPAHRAQNRRVDIVVLSSLIADTAVGDQTPAAAAGAAGGPA